MQSLCKEEALKLAKKEGYEAAGPARLEPILLVFDALPRLPVNPKDVRDLKIRMQAMHLA